MCDLCRLNAIVSQFTYLATNVARFLCDEIKKKKFTNIFVQSTCRYKASLIKPSCLLIRRHDVIILLSQRIDVI